MKIFWDKNTKPKTIALSELLFLFVCVILTQFFRENLGSFVFIDFFFMDEHLIAPEGHASDRLASAVSTHSDLICSFVPDVCKAS